MRLLFIAAAFALCVALASDQTVRAEGWGNIKGQVVFAGSNLPAPEKINVTVNQAQCLKNGPLFAQKWVINPKNKGVKNVFAWLIPGEGGSKLPINPKLADLKKKPVVIDQPCCQFEPHALALWEGQELVVKNSATIPHNVNVTGTAANSFNVIVPPEKSITKKELKAQRLPLIVACNIHPWMNARMIIRADPYFAVTDADGNFEIKGAPAGKWRMVVWQEEVGWGPAGKMGQPVTVTDGKTTDAGKIGLKPE